MLMMPRGPSAAAASSAAFHSKSFKDVDFLLHSEDDPWVCRRPSLAPFFHQVLLTSSALRSWRSLSSASSVAVAASALSPDLFAVPAGEEKRIVLYYTSLHVVRKTFENCRDVRSILHGFRVAVDERDVFMDAGFLAELDGLLPGRRRRHQNNPQHQRLSVPSLPQVFIGGRHVGGAEQIRLLHESGELKRCVEGVEPAAAGACEGCGDARFVVCGNCSGSRKCFVEKGGGAAAGIRSCKACNENGLVRCQRCI